MTEKKVKAPTVLLAKISDLKPDALNANKGTERGLVLLDDSISEDGLGRGILLDSDLNVIAGNKTLQTAVEDGFTEVIIVPTDGKTLVATQRTDVSIDSTQGRRMALRDNRVSEVDLSWDADVLLKYQGDGVELLDVFSEEELTALLDINADDGTGTDTSVPDPTRVNFVFFRFGDFHSLVSKTVYQAFAAEINRRKQNDQSVLLDDVLQDWLNERETKQA